MRLASLSKKSDFRKLFRHGRKFFKEHMTASALVLPEAQSDALLRAAYTTPKKKFSKAVTRNSIKRKLRAALRAVISDASIDHSKLEQNILLNIFPSNTITQIKYKQLHTEVQSMFFQTLAHYAKSRKDSQ